MQLFRLVDYEYHFCSEMKREETADMDAPMSELPTTLKHILTTLLGNLFR